MSILLNTLAFSLFSALAVARLCSKHAPPVKGCLVRESTTRVVTCTTITVDVVRLVPKVKVVGVAEK